MIATVQTTLLITLILTLTSLPTSAEQLIIKSVISTSSEAAASKRPVRGMSMQQVKSQFGLPIKTHKAVGKNTKRRHHHAITRWTYKDFTVFFAEQQVINSVTLKKPTQ